MDSSLRGSNIANISVLVGFGLLTIIIRWYKIELELICIFLDNKLHFSKELKEAIGITLFEYPKKDTYTADRR